MAITLKKAKAPVPPSAPVAAAAKVPLKFTAKAKSKPAANVNTASENEIVMLSDFAYQIDLVGTLQEQVEPIQKQIKALEEKLKPLADATKKLQQILDELEVDDDATLNEIGSEFRCEVKAKGSSRSITDMNKVREMLGDETFFKLATITLKDADAYLTPPQKEEVIATARTKRGFKIVKRAA